ncbi:hypothetical protein PAXINDRAFT_79923 [Paxillus involutus ATCC 200175]|uniref:Unplaced genomic scaffold PAXINscaffold_24, whole genome shotgun sequence n=1 Tax=Paxillus involutus ATCC 200175 TaxID=664439 RepID=A0A0C9U397_PAXIN|nr:hypothetical protein PAXINDRAFT_79923 [Paxillus involutus ATCC 200175]
MRVFEGHTSKVRCVCFYPDENKLVSGSGDGTLRIWDRKTGAVEVLKGHTFDVWGVDVSRDGKMVVSGSWDKTVRIWNAESGETTCTIETQSWVKSVQFSHDSSRVVAGLEDSTARVWSVETGKLAFEPIKCHRGSVECVRYSPSGDRIASASARGSVAIWNSHNGEQLRTWKAHNNVDSPTSLSLSPTGTHLATSNWDEKIPFVFDISTGEQVAALWHGENVNEIAYSPSGQFIATACQDNKVYLWQVSFYSRRP